MDTLGHLDQDRVRSQGQGPMGGTRYYTVRRLCISTLHVSLIIGCCRALNPQRVAFIAGSIREPAQFMAKAGISEASAMTA